MNGRSVLARQVRRLRREARLTQAQLAQRLGKSQTVVSLAETGVSRIGERYLHAVMAACGAPVEGAGEQQASNGAVPRYAVGMDPETGEVVERGTARDAELCEKYVWWSNGYWAG